MRFARPGGAALLASRPLAYSIRMGENTFRYRLRGSAGQPQDATGPPGASPDPPGASPDPPGGSPHPPGASPDPPGAAPDPPGGSPHPPGGWLAAPSGLYDHFDCATSTYWRRRFVVLAIGLPVFATAAWTLSDALKVSPGPVSPGSRSGLTWPRTGSGATEQGSGGQGPGISTGAPGGPASPGRSSPAGRPSRAGRSGRAALTDGRPAPTPSPSPSPSPSPRISGFHGFQPAFCARSSVVLTLAATQATFGAHQLAGFSLSVVSTQQRSCSFNIGPGHLALVVTEGPARIWSSADCVSGTASIVSALRRGVPTVVAISWNRQTSAPGCSIPARVAPPGTYTGYAVDGSLTSAPVTFRLR